VIPSELKSNEATPCQESKGASDARLEVHSTVTEELEWIMMEKEAESVML
jgi:hypothetical protein